MIVGLSLIKQLLGKNNNSNINPVLSSNASWSMVNSAFKNKGNVKKSDKNKLIEEINIKWLRARILRSSDNFKVPMEKNLSKLTSEQERSLFESRQRFSSNPVENLPRLTIADDIRFLLAERIRSKHWIEQIKNSEGKLTFKFFDDISN